MKSDLTSGYIHCNALLSQFLVTSFVGNGALSYTLPLLLVMHFSHHLNPFLADETCPETLFDPTREILQCKLFF